MKTSCFKTLLLLFFLPAIAFAHIGSPGVLVQQQAGKYQLLVSIEPPDVVPGTAKITVFVERGSPNTILARPIYFLSGDEGAPTHDALLPVAGKPGQFAGIVWMMSSGSSSVELQLDGPDGSSKTIVPVVAVSTAQRPLPAETGWILAALGLLLVVLMITVVGSSVSDGTMAPGQAKPKTLGRKRLVGMSVAGVVLILILSGWRFWWTSWADNYQNNQLYRALAIETKVVARPGTAPALIMKLDTGSSGRGYRRRPLSFILPDHGKLMHVFLVKMPGLAAFAHLHPMRQDTAHYQTTLPNLPAGKYLVYADVVYRSGFTETMTDTLDIPAVAATTPAKLADADDSYQTVQAIGKQANGLTTLRLDAAMASCGKPGASVSLGDGSVMVWTDKPALILEAATPYVLKFAVADAAGKPAALEPYLGMGGHAVIVREDGSVYVHLHPVGTASMAAETALASRIADTNRTFKYPAPAPFRDSIDRYVARLRQLPEAEKNKLLLAQMPPMSHAIDVPNMVEFPYSFPRAGQYRLWVQVKRNGRVLTGVFDVNVNESSL